MGSSNKKSPKGKSWEDAVADGSFAKSLKESSDAVPKNMNITLTPEEQYVVFAAMCVMISDIHTVQDQMSDEQWTLAEDLYKRLTKAVDKTA